ncbi:Calcium-transporting ATPase [Arthrobacter sp. Bi83]|uniref:cation-translocating P-type ATPase n=1 Tax=Arthrobacter sp. Bi83 TaxID=2822353 RepID=UPI001D33BC0D|nr:cation-transporting P-type ATPase [Arthrobacter sp. Bi83]CAH0130917.1 Calcium-transporting ATPase [Arthrobacter sp. Bi83]
MAERAVAASGLTTGQALSRLAENGPNRIPEAAAVPLWRRFLAEFTHFFAALLWGAAALAFVAGMPQLGVAVVAVVVINGLFSYVQAERAEHAATQLRALLPTQVLVRRDGRASRVDAADLVPGDLVILAAGDRVPADVRFGTTSSCTVDESMLTGESDPVPKQSADAGIGGTFLVNGEAEGIVIATGQRTRLAEIAALTTTVKPPPSPLTMELRRIVRTIAAVALGVGLLFFLLSALIGISWQDAFLFAIGVSVALIPEGLLPTVTLSLAMGAQRMARRKALVRHLQAVETLGSTTFICTDKTGTLTQNRMSAVEVWTPEGAVTVAGEGYEPAGSVSGSREAVAQAGRVSVAAALASRGRIVMRDGAWQPEGDPMEAALDTLLRRLGGAAERPEAPSVLRFSFSPGRRRESVIVGTTVSMKGAPEAVLPLCSPTASRNAGDSGVRQEIQRMAGQGLRLLAVAGRTLSAGELSAAAAGSLGADQAESGLTLLGLIGLHDPPRPSVAPALRTAREAGVKVAMVTGDHPSTAAAIAREVGLILEEERVVEGTDLPDDEGALGALLDHDGVVISRVSPEQKLRVARALQSRGHVVAMTGDGVNDGPALQEADVGVAMGLSGTDVAREAADLVLLDDDFATIVKAIEQGRATYANIRRFLTYHLTDNVAELTPFMIWALSGGSFPLALGVLQILFLDIGTDLLPALALGGEQPGKGVMRRPPERRHLMDGALMVRVFAVLGPVEAFIEMSAFVAVLAAAGWHPGDSPPASAVLLPASGAAFAAVVLGQLANAYACRSSTRPPWRLGWFRNRLLLWSVLIELLAMVVFLGAGPVAALLGHALPPPLGWGIALLAIPAVLTADFVYKTLRHGRLSR